ncbi:hypothetical protein BJX96DRAFT_158877 [Aspergillus floccosus]
MHGDPSFSEDWEQAINWVPDLHWYTDRCGAAGFDLSFMHDFDQDEGYAGCRNEASWCYRRMEGLPRLCGNSSDSCEFLAALQLRNATV